MSYGSRNLPRSARTQYRLEQEYKEANPPPPELNRHDRVLELLTPTDWKEKYKAMARCCHPDRGGDEDSMIALNEVNELFGRVKAKKRALKAYNEDMKEALDDR
jgi:hypothetical protein